MNKKAISAIVATTLLILVAVISVTIFQQWYHGFESDYLVKTEKQRFISEGHIENILNNILYFRNSGSSNLTVKEVKIGDKNCNVAELEIPKGMTPIDIGNCISGFSDSVIEILVITDQDVYSKSMYLENDNLSITENYLTHVVDDFNFGTLNQIQFNLSDLILNKISEDYVLTGNYTSKIYDAENDAIWTNLTWNFELQSSTGVENNDLIAHYKFDGNVNDDLGSYNLTLNGPITIEGKINDGYSFDGIDDYLYKSSYNSLHPIFTVSGWIKTTQTTDGFIFQLGRSSSDANTEAALLIGSGKLEYWDYGSSYGFNHVSSVDNVNDGSWNFFTLVRNNNILDFYVNGIFDSEYVGNSVIYSSNDFCIGKDYRDNNKFFEGNLDEISFWNRNLSATEINNLYNSGNGKSYPFMDSTRLVIQTRTSDDNINWGDWETQTMPQEIIDSSARYFQFRVLFDSDNVDITPILKQVSFDYKLN